MRSPGVIVLHDVVLHHLIVELPLARGAAEGYVAAMPASRHHSGAGGAWGGGPARVATWGGVVVGVEMVFTWRWMSPGRDVIEGWMYVVGGGMGGGMGLGTRPRGAKAATRTAAKP